MVIIVLLIWLHYLIAENRLWWTVDEFNKINFEPFQYKLTQGDFEHLEQCKWEIYRSVVAKGSLSVCTKNLCPGSIIKSIWWFLPFSMNFNWICLLFTWRPHCPERDYNPTSKCYLNYLICTLEESGCWMCYFQRMGVTLFA